jgi:hypothetical protein
MKRAKGTPGTQGTAAEAPALELAPTPAPVFVATTPTQLLWDACGRPPSHKAGPLPTSASPEEDWSRCWVCAGETFGRGSPIVKWDGANFTGQTRVRYPAGQAICEPCLWVMARHSEVPGKTGNWRNYSVLWAEGEPLLIASKGDKPAILAWLRRISTAAAVDVRTAPRRWFAALAESGQKHVVPYVPLNGRGTQRTLFDEQYFDLPRTPEGWSAVDELAALLTAGATKEEVERGAYNPFTVQRCEAAIRAFEGRNGHLRGGGWFALVVFLAQRDEAAVEQRLAAEAAARAEKKARTTKTAKSAKRPTVTRVTRGGTRTAREAAEDAAEHGGEDGGHGGDGVGDGVGVAGEGPRGGEGAPRRPDGGRRARAAGAVPRRGRQRDQALGPARGPDARGDTHERGAGGVGHEAHPRPQALGAVAGDLGGDGGPDGVRAAGR